MKGNHFTSSCIFHLCLLCSDTIENSDVFANEDFEYIVQAERSQELLNCHSSMEDSNEVRLMDIDINTNEAVMSDFIFPSVPRERKSSFSSNVTASSVGSRDTDSPRRGRKKANLVLNSKFSSKIYLQNEGSVS